MSTDREHVLREAARHLNRRPAASMDEIARAAGISRATLHRMYPGRDALALALGSRALEQVSAAVDAARLDEGDAAAALRRMVDELMPIAEFLGFLYGENALVDNPEIDAAWEAVDSRVTAVVRRGQQDGSLRIDLPAQWISEAAFSLAVGAGWSVRDGRLARRDAPRVVAELLIGGVRRGPDPAVS
ncbi:TetR/AcrR family transcriptional regulator [Yinghuangia soli]|uniref:TetR/AcrR family transcriptional regulator n=1 Tax=Yinghuangia soli TaxID=2908204 RepID=A0AA41PYT9_9ACTN|nr:TetR/AcrR family transcriptional regulator [Yinghuangia soli]MCF2527661.1 TetR/AcrR family transcriptional regulator [Yinghuangia soli]